MKSYVYKGPAATGMTLASGQELLLWPGKALTLSAEDALSDVVLTLLALGYLAVASPAPPAAVQEGTETAPALAPAQADSGSGVAKKKGA